MRRMLFLLCLLYGTTCYARDDDGGSIGPRGPQGAQGPIGQTGPVGSAGANYSTPLISPFLDLGLQVYGSRRVDAGLHTTFLFNQPSVTYMMGVSVLFKPFREHK